MICLHGIERGDPIVFPARLNLNDFNHIIASFKECINNKGWVKTIFLSKYNAKTYTSVKNILHRMACLRTFGSVDLNKSSKYGI